jgi:hypothetical protein
MVQLIEWGLEDRRLALFPFFVFVFYFTLLFFIFLKFRYELNVYYIHELEASKPKKVYTHTHIRLGKWYRSAAFFDHHDRQNLYSYTSILRKKHEGSRMSSHSLGQS